MALVNPNIAMSFRQPEIQAPNALAQYAQLQQIQGGQQAQELNKLQIQEYQRAREEEEGTRNFLRGRKLSDPETLAGLAAFGKTGLAYAKQIQDQEAAALNAKNTQSQINQRDWETQDRKLKFAWNAVGSAPTPQDAITELTKGVKDGVFDMKSATSEIQQLQSMTPDQYRKYRIEKIMGIVDAKDKLGFMMPKNVRQDAGGKILTIQDNPMLPGYGQPIAGLDIAKTATIADNIAQQRLSLEGQRVGLERERVDIARKDSERKTQGLEALPPKEVQKREAAFPQATAAVKGFESKSDSFIKDLKALRDHPGLSQITGFVAGRAPALTAEGRAAQALYDKVVAKGGFQALQDMRDASKTGGALGNVSNQEGKQLTASFAAIDRRQDAPDVRAAIDDAIGSVEGAKTRMREAYDSTYSYKAPPAAAGGTGVDTSNPLLK